MKKFLLLCCLVAFIAGCSSEGIHDSYASYRDQTASQLYHGALKKLQKGHYEDAQKSLEALNALYPFGAYAEEGQVNLMYAYYQDDDNDEALVTAERYLRLYPRGQYADYVYYMKGVIAFDEGFSWFQKKMGVNSASRDVAHFKHAFLAFNQLAEEFPGSPYVPDALIRMRYIRNVMAENEAGIADYYYQRKAYVAAINRATVVVQHFDRTPAMLQALTILVKSYRALGLTVMANNTMAIFKASYPESTAYKRLL